MDKTIKQLVINSNSIPKSIQSSVPGSICLHNLNLFKEYVKNNQMKESFQFTRRYTRFSELLIPQTTRGIMSYGHLNKKKASKLYMKDVSLHESERTIEKNRLWKQIINSPPTIEMSYSMRHVHPSRLLSSKINTSNTKAKRIMTCKPKCFKKINLHQLKSAPPNNNQCDLIRFQCLFRNDLIKRLFNNRNGNSKNSNSINNQKNDYGKFRSNVNPNQHLKQFQHCLMNSYNNNRVIYNNMNDNEDKDKEDEDKEKGQSKINEDNDNDGFILKEKGKRKIVVKVVRS